MTGRPDQFVAGTPSFPADDQDALESVSDQAVDIRQLGAITSSFSPSARKFDA